jgi:hypothetical protein
VRARAWFVAACLTTAVAAQQQGPEKPGAEPSPSRPAQPPFVEAAEKWIATDQGDADARAEVVQAILQQQADSFPWLRAELAKNTDAAEKRTRGLRALHVDTVIAFVMAQRRSGVVYRGQYLGLEPIQPFAVETLFDLLLRTPDWFDDTWRIHLVPAIADLQKTQPEPSLLLGVVDIVENVDIEPATLRNALATLLWQWGRKEFVEARARELRDQSGEGDAEDRVLAFRELSDLWYRVNEPKRAASTHAAMTALADSAQLELLPTDWYWGACYNALCGKLDAGFAALSRCADLQASDRVDTSRKLPHVLWQVDPDIAALRADVRFVPILLRAFPQPKPEEDRKGDR